MKNLNKKTVEKATKKMVKLTKEEMVKIQGGSGRPLAMRAGYGDY